MRQILLMTCFMLLAVALLASVALAQTPEKTTTIKIKEEQSKILVQLNTNIQMKSLEVEKCQAQLQSLQDRATLTLKTIAEDLKIDLKEYDLSTDTEGLLVFVKKKKE